ncbi:unnamed protein product [Hapterophycus canaliculatus]
MRASSKRLLGGEPEEKSTLQEMEEAVCSVCPSLSWRNRLIGYGATLACGFCLSFGSLFRFGQLLTGNPRPFVLYFSLGSLLSICSSFFLTGPWKQLKKMFMPVRAVATIIYLVTLSMTLFVALSPYAYIPGRGILLLCLVVVQFLAYVWYTLSYVPFARRFMAGFWSGLRGLG